MMIHEYHKVVGKTKTRQLRLKNKNRVSLYSFYLTVDSFKDTLGIHSNHKFPISLTLQSFDLSTETTAVQLEILEVSCMPHNKLNRACARF